MEVTVEAERLSDGQVGLDRKHGGSGLLLLAEDLTTTLAEHRVDTTDDRLRALDLDEVDGLQEPGICEQTSGVADTTTHRDNLSPTTMDGITK